MTLRFIHLSDTHYTPDLAYTRPWAPIPPLTCIEAVLNAVRTLPFTPDFVLHTGDVVYDPFPEHYPAVRALFATLGVPVVYLPGNHDDIPSVRHVLMNQPPDQPGDDHTFARGGVQFACVNSAVPGQVGGHYTDAQLAWLHGLAHADDPRPLIVATHHNVLPFGDTPWHDDFMRTDNGEAFHAALVGGRRVRAVLHGHVHHALTVVRDGILYSAVPGVWGQFHIWPGMEETTADMTGLPAFQVVTVTDDAAFFQKISVRVSG